MSPISVQSSMHSGMILHRVQPILTFLGCHSWVFWNFSLHPFSCTCYFSASLESQWNHCSVPVHGLQSLLVDSQATSVCVQTLEIDPFVLLLQGKFQRFFLTTIPPSFLTTTCAFTPLQVMVIFHLHTYFFDISPLSNPLLKEYISKARIFLFRIGWYWISSYLDGPFAW